MKGNTQIEIDENKNSKDLILTLHHISFRSIFEFNILF